MRLALLLPLWLVFATGEPSLVHPCPMHGAALEALVDGDLHTGHANHPAAAERGGEPSPHLPAPHSHGCCSCIGACTAAAGVVAPQAASIPLGVISLGEPPAPSPLVRVVRVRAHRVLPYANGPPADRG